MKFLETQALFLTVTDQFVTTSSCLRLRHWPLLLFFVMKFPLSTRIACKAKHTKEMQLRCGRLQPESVTTTERFNGKF